MRLLLVEDNEADVFLVQDAMRQEGIAAHIEVASDGETAINLIRRSDASGDPLFDCFLLDFNLPRHGGPEILQALRQSSRYADSPVMMMTSSDVGVRYDEMHAAGATKIFTKPYKLNEFRSLVRAVQQICDAHHPSKQLPS